MLAHVNWALSSLCAQMFASDARLCLESEVCAVYCVWCTAKQYTVCNVQCTVYS